MSNSFTYKEGIDEKVPRVNEERGLRAQQTSVLKPERSDLRIKMLIAAIYPTLRRSNSRHTPLVYVILRDKKRAFFCLAISALSLSVAIESR